MNSVTVASHGEPTSPHGFAFQEFFENILRYTRTLTSPSKTLARLLYLLPMPASCRDSCCSLRSSRLAGLLPTGRRLQNWRRFARRSGRSGMSAAQLWGNNWSRRVVAYSITSRPYHTSSGYRENNVSEAVTPEFRFVRYIPRCCTTFPVQVQYSMSFAVSHRSWLLACWYEESQTAIICCYHTATCLFSTKRKSEAPG